MAVIVIGVIAALLVALTLGFALLIEIRTVRSEIAHGNRTQHRIALVEGGRYRSSKRTHGERAGRRADYEDRISRYANDSLDKLESIRALLASLAAPERAAVEAPAATGDEEDEAAERLTSKLPEEPGAVAAYVELATVPGAVAAPMEAEEELTNVWTASETADVRREAAAGGAACRPSATPRAALSVAVAPPASAPPPPPSKAAALAAGLGRPKSTRSPPQAPVVAVPRFPATLVSMGAQSAAPHEPPMYAPRSEPIHPPSPLAPLAHPDLIGSEDHADEAARSRLGPEDETPPRIGRAAMRLPVFQTPEEGA